MKAIHGVIHGKTITLTDAPPLKDGAEVELVVRPAKGSRPWGDGLRRCAGALADAWTAEDDRILAQLRHDRDHSTRHETPHRPVGSQPPRTPPTTIP